MGSTINYSSQRLDKSETAQMVEKGIGKFVSRGPEFQSW